MYSAPIFNKLGATLTPTYTLSRLQNLNNTAGVFTGPTRACCWGPSVGSVPRRGNVGRERQPFSQQSGLGQASPQATLCPRPRWW